MLYLRSKLPTNQLKVDDGSGGFCYSHWLVMALSINQETQREKGRKSKKKRDGGLVLCGWQGLFPYNKFFSSPCFLDIPNT
jgi:hypothetical protein